MSEIRVDTISEKTSANGVAVDGVTLKDGGIAATDGCTITTADNTYTLILKSTDADANQGPLLSLHRDSGSPADNDTIGGIQFRFEDDAGNVTTGHNSLAQIVDASNGSEDCTLVEQLMIGGSAVETVRYTAAGTIFNEQSADLDFRIESNGNANMLFVDGGSDHVNIGTATDLGGVLNVSGTAVFSSTSADDNFVITSTDADAGDPAPDLVLYRNSSSPANGDDIGRIEFRARNNNSQDIVPVTFSAFTAVVTDGAETGNFAISTLIGGSQINRMGFDPTETTFNDGSADLDFRVESNGTANMLFVNGGTNKVGIGTNAPAELLEVEGTGAAIQIDSNGDSALRFATSGTVKHSIFSSSGALNFFDNTNSATRMSIDANGAVTKPLQPCFRVGNGTQNNIPVNANQDAVFDNEIFDIGSNFASSAFTAPVTGKYFFTVSYRIADIDSAASFIQVVLVGSNRNTTLHTLNEIGNHISADTEYSFTGTSILDMDANDTANVRIRIQGGTAQSDIDTDGSYFMGYLIG